MSYRTASPQQKNMFVQNQLGNRGIKNQQGSTVVIYDSLPLDGRNMYEFFRESANRAFPFTNLINRGGMLNVGESLVVQRAYFTVLEVSPVDGSITSITEVDETTFPDIAGGELSMNIANQITLKPMPILSFVDKWNKSAEFIGDSTFEFDTLVVIPPLLEFIANVKLPAGVTVANSYLRLTIEGAGSIINPKKTL